MRFGRMEPCDPKRQVTQNASEICFAAESCLASTLYCVVLHCVVLIQVIYQLDRPGVPLRNPTPSLSYSASRKTEAANCFSVSRTVNRIVLI